MGALLYQHAESAVLQIGAIKAKRNDTKV